MWRADHPAQLVFGLTLWAIYFIVLYGGLSVGCAVAPPAQESGALNPLNGLLMLLALVVTALLLHGAWRCRRAARSPDDNHKKSANRRMIARVSAGLYLFSALATLGIGLPVLVLPPCL